MLPQIPFKWLFFKRFFQLKFHIHLIPTYTLWPVSKVLETVLVSNNGPWSSLYIKSNRPVVFFSTTVARAIGS
jgi:hypothetical protein